MTAARINESPETIFRHALEDGILTYQRCRECESAVFYPRLLCSICASTDLRWETSGGAGVLYSATTVRSRSGDYSVVLVDLDEGFRMMSRLAEDSGPVAIGDRVQATLESGMTLDKLTFTKEGL